MPTYAMQRTHEERRALFSCFYWAIFSWNCDEMGSHGDPPQLALWARLLVRSSPAEFAALTRHGPGVPNMSGKCGTWYMG